MLLVAKGGRVFGFQFRYLTLSPQKILLIYVICEELTSDILMNDMHLFNNLHAMLNDILNNLSISSKASCDSRRNEHDVDYVLL